MTVKSVSRMLPVHGPPRGDLGAVAAVPAGHLFGAEFTPARLCAVTSGRNALAADGDCPGRAGSQGLGIVASQAV
ncbi:hypothetical protein [Kribbella catacumbae]|uniref:hypothetical protein n=1 Tax=Kribbella catacumbae TaxID=460086 RepID=UPI0012FACD12|nr:hypothetical protein [Kribbella catacumbae]